jgi:hypothetical protein
MQTRSSQTSKQPWKSFLRIFTIGVHIDKVMMRDKELTVAATRITASGFLGIGKRVTSVSDSTFLIRSLTSSRVIATLSAARSSLSASQAVPCFKIPSQNATTAECGERKGSVATGVG